MTIQKRFLSLLGGVAFAAATLATANAQETIVLGDIYAADHSNSVAEAYFADLVKERSNGELIIENYFDSTLGNERELAEGVVSGSVDIAPSGVSGIGRFFPQLQVLELPYLYSGLEQMVEVADAIAPDVDAAFESQGVKNLGFLFLGPRSMASAKPIHTIEDLEGLRLRVPESPLYVGLAQFMGAVPTPVAFPEVYTALETGVAQAAEGEPATLATTRWYEPTKSVSLTKHIWHYRLMPMNLDRFNSLSAEHQQILLDAAKDTMVYQAGLVNEYNERALQQIRDAGIEIIETQGIEILAERFQEFHDSFAGDLGPEAVALLDKVRTITRAAE